MKIEVAHLAIDNEKFLDVLQHEGAVAIITLAPVPTAVTNTWMSYLRLDKANDKIYIPAAGMHSVEEVVAQDNHLKLTMGSKEVEGTVGPGAGFHVTGTGKFIDNGPVFDQMKADFPWVTRVLEISVTDISQKI
ncbi:pyridoxamine 5'-phosphate oxidase family protein [Loigolactobacillus bifermentans]|nr:pyridoxamine 5'-phosphate oxidase family protein [Loigolactobacillus bifermentans]